MRSSCQVRSERGRMLHIWEHAICSDGLVMGKGNVQGASVGN